MSTPTGETFELHVIGDETGETFTGKFRAKEKLSWNDQLNIDTMRRELLGINSAEASVDAQQRATVIAELAVRLTEAPDFWKNARGGRELIDDNVVMAVYQKALEVRAKWVEAQQKKGEAAKKALAEKQEK